MQESEQITDIIGKKLGGEASVAELEQLQRWLDAAASNRLEYDQLVKIWTETTPALHLPAFDVDAAWQKVDGRIGVKSMAFYTRRLVAAAAMVAVVAAGWWLWNKNNPHWQQFEAVAANQSLQLPDGSTVLLRKGSKLKYPPVFDKNERTVELTGEAFFKVQHNEQQPFRITTSHAKVEVLGTSFLVRSEGPLEEVVVATGRVSVTDKDQRSNHIILAAGQQAILQEDKFSQGLVTDSNYMAWKTGLLDFKGASLQKVLDDVQHYYSVSIELAGGQSVQGKDGITVRFENEPFDSVLEEIKLVTGLEVKKENGKYLLYQK
ncbi:MAG TPA: FecR domain-containing protein [Chitinophagaceae bacterium]